MLYAYFDDSKGIEGDGETVALGGSVAREEDWCRLLPKWEGVVRDSGMGWFHAVEWNSRGADLQKQWKTLIEIANNHVIAHIGCTVPAHAVAALRKKPHNNLQEVNSIERIWEQEWRVFENDPMSVCLSHCISKILEIHPGRKVALTFAKTDKLEGRHDKLSLMLDALDRTRDVFGPRKFDGDPRQLLQLQVADLVAYELTCYRHLGRPRWQFQMLRSKLQHQLADPPRLACLLEL